MTGYIISLKKTNGSYYTLGRGYQLNDGILQSEHLFKSLTWRTKEEAKEALDYYIKRCNNSDFDEVKIEDGWVVGITLYL